MPTNPSIVQLSALNGANGFRLAGVANGDETGYSVGSAGDVNGDGFDDMIIGAWGADPHGQSSGSTYVVFGKAGGFVGVFNLSTLNGANGFRLDGELGADRSGFSVSSAGDVNGDGFDDILIGASLADTHGSSSGAAYVVFGKAGGFASTSDLASLNGSNGFSLSGAAADDFAGYSVAAAGDVNGDGFADVIVGAWGVDHNGNSGSSYVVFGKAAGFAANINLSALNGSNGFRLDGQTANERSGISVASAGDVNGDGIDDLIVGASAWGQVGGFFAGASYVVFGKTSGFTSVVNLSSLNGNNGFRMIGAPGDFSGKSVASAGDINGDGFDDLIVGANGADPSNLNYAGASYVVFGKAGGFAASLNLATLNGTNGFRLDGVAADDRSGISVASAGDINGDGYSDLIIGAAAADPNGNASGSSYVVFGKAGGFASSISLSSLNGTTGFRIDGLAAYERSGISVASAGDVNGDGFDDLIVGGSEAANGGNATGSGYVIFGRATAAVNRTGTSAGENIFGGDYNDTLIGLGGVDRLDGRGGHDTLSGGAGSDVLVGGAGGDSLDGGSGSDLLSYEGSLAGVTVNLKTGAASGGDAASDTFISFERIMGSSVNDNLTGSDFANVLTGGIGQDTLAGGLGKDVFDFDALTESSVAPAGRDAIVDFNEAATDKIDLSTIDANGVLAGNNAFTFIGTAAFTGLGQVRAFANGANTIVDINTTGSAAADMRIFLIGLHTLDLQDFIL